MRYIRELIKKFSSRGLECGRVRHILPTTSFLVGLYRKKSFQIQKEKSSETFLACCNSDALEKMTLMVIGIALSPRCFQKMASEEVGLIITPRKRPG